MTATSRAFGPDGHPAERARRLLRDGMVALSSGHRQLGLALIETAVSILRGLAVERPAYRAELADALHTFAVHARHARPGDAIDAIRESVEILRRLAGQGSGRAAMSFADVLLRLADVTDQPHERVAARTEAVHILRSLAQNDVTGAIDDPRRHDDRVRYVDAMDLLWRDLLAVDREDAALNTLIAAIDVHRRLAEWAPAERRPHLAATLDDLNGLYDCLGRTAEAAEAHRESLDLTFAMAADQPDDCPPDLATRLTEILHDLDDRQ